MSLQNYIVLAVIFLGKIAAIFWMHLEKKKKERKVTIYWKFQLRHPGYRLYHGNNNLKLQKVTLR